MASELYEILGVSAGASMDEIHAAFRKKAREHHPDLGGNRKKFQQLNTAYEKLIKLKESETPPTLEPPADSEVKPRSPLNPYRPPPPSTPRKKSKSESKTATGPNSLKHLLTGKLPLQDQTTYFILVNTLDIFLTYLHLRSGNVEANPIANFFISRWNIVGMIAFKLAVVASVCVIAQIVAISSIQKASKLLYFGTGIITCIVIYSIWLLAR